MSAATDALLSRLFKEAALPAAPPPLAAGELRFAGQTLSAAVAKLYRSERRLWLQQRRSGDAGKWLEPHSGELPPDVSLDQLRAQLADFFDIREARARAVAPYIARASRLHLLMPLALRRAA